MEEQNIMVNLRTNNNSHLGCHLLLLFQFLILPIVSCPIGDNPLFQGHSVRACAIVINEKDTTDSLVFQLEIDMIISILYESENIRMMSERELLESIDNMNPFIIDEEIFLKLKSRDWAVHPSAYLDSIYGAAGINGVIAECFFPVDGVLYMKNRINKDGHPVVWTDYCWEMHPGDYDFYADANYIIFLLQKHHLYTRYTSFINTQLLSTIDVVVAPTEFELR